MIREGSEFRKSITRLRTGDDNAAWHIIEEYGPHIQRIVRRRLDQRMRSKFDSIDFVQMVWASFFKHPSQIVNFNEPDDLVRYLAVIAKNKVVDEYRRRLRYRKYNVARERSLRDSDVAPNRIEAAHPTPSQIAMAREQWTQIMEQQSDRNRQIVRMRLRGATFEEIAKELGISERTARKVIDDLLGEERASLTNPLGQQSRQLNP